ncbi:hypothetical protein H1O16_gp121 [Burkholderia phage BcepSaruman]|uniref:Uncharacterized protein n=1 Tax=Burkholderia phage BcepSaruman TaxID=2530032 RepID=A0A4D5ZC53_9CAUD|nr:hypothetical protein H1O16_gp121 [Burkholderia phage BcepSaruman]QBX06534.1 hypothetical protein BcepSaruman_121 [Burkholderia phage BcepSaruman]
MMNFAMAEEEAHRAARRHQREIVSPATDRIKSEIQPAPECAVGHPITGTVVLAIEWTEHEDGFARPDGWTYAVERDRLDSEIARQKSYDSPHTYVTCSHVMHVLADDYLTNRIRAEGCVNTPRHKHAGHIATLV